MAHHTRAQLVLINKQRKELLNLLLQKTGTKHKDIVDLMDRKFISVNLEELTDEEQAEVQKLKERDQEVRTHEKAHQTAGGQYASAPVYDFKKGPDGKDYAVGGHVNIDTSKESDPDKTIEKMRVVIKAAKAPAQPSGQDMKVAAEAQQTLNEAQMEKAKKQQEEMKANENPQKTEDSETEVQSEDIRTETPETKPQASLSEA